jgi:hypothetical protein
VPIGTALIVICGIYLIDKHGLWKRATRIAIGLAILVGLVFGGMVVYVDTRPSKPVAATQPCDLNAYLQGERLPNEPCIAKDGTVIRYPGH